MSALPSISTEFCAVCLVYTLIGIETVTGECADVIQINSAFRTLLFLIILKVG